MNIEISAFESNFHSARKIETNTRPCYIFANIDVWNTLTIGGDTHCAMYQAGMDYLGNDYSCPSPKLELSGEGGASDLLVLVNDLWSSDFDDDSIAESVEKAHEMCKAIKNKADIWQLYEILMDNAPEISHYLPFDSDSDNLEEGDEGNIVVE